MLKQNQKGMVSIFVTMIMMIVISLIVLGFASIGRNNQRQALDRQLSTQAYYAAETGVNDAVSYIKNHPTGLTQNTRCTDFAGWTLAQSVLAKDPSNNPIVSYTCLMVNPHPKTLEKKPLNEEQSVVWPLAESDGSALGNLDIEWAPKTTATTTPKCNGVTVGTGTRLPAFDSWVSACDYGLMRVDVFDGTASSDASVLASHTRTFYIKPTGVTASPANATQSISTTYPGSIVPITCGQKLCDLPMSGFGNTVPYYVRLTPYYHDSSDVIIKAGHGTFKNAEIVIDATGKAQDELRRVQVRVPLTSSSSQDSVPPYALQTSQGVCKQLTVGNSTHPLLNDDCQ